MTTSSLGQLPWVDEFRGRSPDRGLLTRSSADGASHGHPAAALDPGGGRADDGGVRGAAAARQDAEHLDAAEVRARHEASSRTHIDAGPAAVHRATRDVHPQHRRVLSAVLRAQGAHNSSRAAAARPRRLLARRAGGARCRRKPARDS